MFSSSLTIALFLAITLFAPSPLRYPHHSPYPCLPPLLPLPLPSLLPLLLLARHPCHHCHHLAALTLFVAPSLLSLLPSSLPATVVTAAITLVVDHPPPLLPLPLLLPPLPSPSSSLTTLIAIAIALFITSAFTHPPSLSLLHCRSGGEGRTIPIRHAIQLWPPLPVPPSLLPPLPPAQPTGRGLSNNARAFNARQMACTNVARLLPAIV
jgi:hypothetical protein